MNEHNKSLWLYSFSIIFVILGIFLFANNLQAASVTDPMTITVDISADNAVVGKGEDIRFSATIMPATGNDLVNATIFFEVGETEFSAELTGSDNPYTHTLTVADSMTNGELSFVKISIYLSDSDDTTVKEQRNYTESHTDVTVTLSPATISIDTIEDITDPSSITLDISTTRSDTDVRIGESINFAADIDDSGEGIATGVDLHYKIAGGSQQVLSLSDNTTHWINSLDVVSSTSSGDFTFESLSITLRNADDDDTTTRLFNTASLSTLTSPDTITINPTAIQSVTDPTSIEVSITSDETDLRNGDTIAFSVDITDAANGKATDATLTYTIGSTNSMIALTRQSDGTWTNTLTIISTTADGTLSFDSITIVLENGDGSASITRNYMESSDTVTTVTDDDIEILSVNKVTDPASIDVSITSNESTVRNGYAITFRVDTSNTVNGKVTSVIVKYRIDGNEYQITLTDTSVSGTTWTKLLTIDSSTPDGSLTFSKIILGLQNGDGITDTREYSVTPGGIVTVTAEPIQILSTDRVTDPASVDVSITSDKTTLRNGDTIVFSVDISNATNGKAINATILYRIGGSYSTIALTRQSDGTWTNTLTIISTTADGTLSFIEINIGLENGDGTETKIGTYVKSDTLGTMVTVDSITIDSTDRVTDPTSVEVSITSSETNLRNGDTIVFRADISNATNGKATSVIITYSIGDTDSTITLMNQGNDTWSKTITIMSTTDDGILMFVNIMIGLESGDELETDTRTYEEGDTPVTMVTDDDISILSTDRVTDPTSVDVSITADETNLRNGDTIVFRADISNATHGKATSVIITYSIGDDGSTITLTNQGNDTWSKTLTIISTTDDGTLMFTNIIIELENGDGMDTDTRTYLESNLVTVTVDSITILSVDRVTDPEAINISITSDKTSLRNGDTIIFTATITDATNGKATAVSIGYDLGNRKTIELTKQADGTWTATLIVQGDTADGKLTFADITLGLQNGDGTETGGDTYDADDSIVTVTEDSITILSVDRVTDPTSVGVSITSDETTLDDDDTIAFSATIVDTPDGQPMAVTVTYNIGGTPLTITLTKQADGTWSNTLTVDANTPNDRLTFVNIIIELQNGAGDETNTRTYVESDDIVTVTLGEITIRGIEAITALNEFNLFIRGDSPVYLNEDISFIAEVNESEQGKVVSIVVNYRIGESNFSIELTDLMNGTWSMTHVIDDESSDKLSFVNMSLTLRNAANSTMSSTVYDLDSNGTDSFYFFIDALSAIPKHRVTDPQSLVFNITSSHSNENIAQKDDEITIKLAINDSTNGIAIKAMITYMIGDNSTLFEELLTQVEGEDTFVFVFTVTEDTPLGKLVLVSVLLRLNNSDGSLTDARTYDLSESEISTIHGSITVNAIEEPVKSSTPPETTSSTKGADSSTGESTSTPSDLDNVIPVSLTPMLVFLAALGTVISVYALKRRRR